MMKARRPFAHNTVIPGPHGVVEMAKFGGKKQKKKEKERRKLSVPAPTGNARVE